MAKKKAIKKPRKKSAAKFLTPREIFMDLAVNEITLNKVDAGILWDAFREAIVERVPEIDWADWPAIAFVRHSNDGVIVRQSLLISGEEA